MLDRAVGEQVADQHALAAAEVTDAPRAGRANSGQHRPTALLGQRHRAVGRFDDPVTVKRVVEFLRLRVVDLGQPGERVLGELARCAR